MPEVEHFIGGITSQRDNSDMMLTTFYVIMVCPYPSHPIAGIDDNMKIPAFDRICAWQDTLYQRDTFIL